MQARAPPHPVLPRKRLSAHNNVLLQTLRERYPLTASLTGTWAILSAWPCNVCIASSYLWQVPVSILCSTLAVVLAGQGSTLQGFHRKGGSRLAAQSTQEGLAAADTMPLSYTLAAATWQHLTVPSFWGWRGAASRLSGAHCAHPAGLASTGRAGRQPSAVIKQQTVLFPECASFRSSLCHTCRSCQGRKDRRAQLCRRILQGGGAGGAASWQGAVLYHAGALSGRAPLTAAMELGRGRCHTHFKCSLLPCSTALLCSAVWR